MIALYDHIQELRLELRGCIMSRRERAAVQHELSQALMQHVALEAALDDIFEDIHAEGG